MYQYFLMVFFFVYLISLDDNKVEGNLQEDIKFKMKNDQNNNSRLLLRARRYLTFPEGSSFQLVYDLAYPSIDGAGFFVYGNTAALAWELPSTPVFLDKKFKKKPSENAPSTTPSLPELEHDHDDNNYHNWHGSSPELMWDTPNYSGWKSKSDLMPAKFGHIDRWPVSLYNNPFVTYRKQTLIPNYHPINSATTYNKNKRLSEFSHKDFQKNTLKKSFRNTSFKSNPSFMDKELYHTVHRRTRREIYTKLEHFFGKFLENGKHCVLKLICETNKSASNNKEKGTFWEELLKIIFKTKPEDAEENEDNYDLVAHLAAQNNCDELYPGCEGNIINKMLNDVVYKKIKPKKQ